MKRDPDQETGLAAEYEALLREVLTAPILYDGVRQGMRYQAKGLNKPLLDRIRAALQIDGNIHDE